MIKIKQITFLAFSAILLPSVFSQNGTVLFNYSTVHEIKVEFSYPDFFDTLEAHYDGFNGNSTYVMATIDIDGTIIDSIGIKEKGFFSNWGMPPGSVKRPFKIDLAEYGSSEKFDGVKKINLQNGFKDPTMMHDPLCYKILRNAGVAAPRTSYAKLYFNGAYWGLYVLAEEPDKNFLEMQYPDKNGNMYKTDNTMLEWEGSARSSYLDNFEQKLSQSGDTSWTDLIHLHDVINNSGTHFSDSVFNNLELTSFLKTMAVDYLTDNWDNFIGHGRNFFLYHSTTSHKFHWIPWDYNLSFSNSNIDVLYNAFNGGPGSLPPLWEKIMNDVDLKSRYLHYVCEINNQVFTNAMQDSYIDSIKTIIETPLADDPNKFFTMAQFNQNINNDINDMGEIYSGLKSHINARHNSAVSELANLGITNSCNLGIEDNIEAYLNIYPNPVTDGITLAMAPELGESCGLEIYNTEGKCVRTVLHAMDQQYIDMSDLNPGIYIVRLTGQGYTYTRKLIKT
jgi:spore coat protein CotH